MQLVMYYTRVIEMEKTDACTQVNFATNRRRSVRIQIQQLHKGSIFDNSLITNHFPFYNFILFHYLDGFL